MKLQAVFPVFICSLLVSVSGWSQIVQTKRIDGSITVDGILDELEWESANAASNFIQYEPSYGTPASYPTFIKILYNDRMIFFGIDCKDPDYSLISSKVTKRDGEVCEDDAVALVLDTFDDDNNAYMFIVNALGTQQDERWADNGRTRDVTWDVEWLSASKVYEGGWSAEVGIPFEVIRFDRSKRQWGFNAMRYIPRNLESSHWAGHLTQWFRISEFGQITGLDLSDVSGKKIMIIPYVQAQLEKGEKPAGDLGADLRIRLSSNLGVDATVNPDFATIEADVEQVNLTRFELSYPEKRPFFMEGAENYSTRIRQFYSRRIGEIPWGMKLNGKVGQWKLNVLATQSDPSSANPQIPSGENAYFSVFRVNREFRKSSNIGIIGANRTYDGRNKGSVGLTTTLFFTKLLGMTSQVIKSYGDYDSGSWTYFFRPAYDSQTAHFHVRYTHVGEHVQENINDVGFIRDDDRREIDSNIEKKFWINKSGVENVNCSINYNQYWSQSGALRSWEVQNDFSIKFLKRWSFSLSCAEEFKRFEKDFRNDVVVTDITFDNKKGKRVSFSIGGGKNYDRDFEAYGLAVHLKLIEGWNLSYTIMRYWFYPDTDADNNLIHYVRSTFYVNKDLFFKLFYQSRYYTIGGVSDPSFDLTRETVQFVFVWRFMPPFGSVQLAFQQGSTRVMEVAGRERTVFFKFSWMI